MSQTTLQFVTRMKLAELRRQRDLLRHAYERLGEEADRAADPAARLRALYEGLRGLKCAGRPLHPEVVNLDVLLHEAASGAAPSSVAALWEERLRAELAAGKLRSEFVFLFGALLEEWAREPAAGAGLAEESERERRRLAGAALAAPETTRHEAFLGALFDALAPEAARIARELPGEWREAMAVPVDAVELGRVLERVADSIYRPGRLRREARRFAADAPACRELADALTILLADAWDWSRDGLDTRALWTRNKWRLYLDEDLPTACLLEVLGGRWADVLRGHLVRQSPAQHSARLKKLTDLNAPEVIVENERRLLSQAERTAAGEFSWGDGAWDAGPAADVTPGSVVVARDERQRSLRGLWPLGDYDGDYAGGPTRLVSLVNAEVRLARAAFPERPLVVVKLDLQDYYPSIPHDVLLTVLRRLGLAGGDVEFFARFLSPPLRSDEAAPARARRGAPMNHALSDALAEVLLRLLEAHVCRHARVRVVRQVDDVCLLAADAAAAVEGWRRVEEFCEACGLNVNLAKSGAVCLGGARPAGLPPGRPRWGMVELDEEGRWGVHEASFAAHLRQTRVQVEAADSLLSRVQVGNANLRFLVSSLAVSARLGEAHRDVAGLALRRFHHDFFGPGRGLLAGLCDAVRERFPTDAGDIPEAWVYWPVTAGGLGLHNPLVIAGQYAAAYRPPADPPAERGKDWEATDGAWGRYYGQFLEPIEPAQPKDTRVMKALVEDFIERGAEISAGRQEGLSPYWRWILCTYGPQILQRFGTFRFLLTELVPLHLIGRRRVQDSSLDSSPSPAGDESDAGEEVLFGEAEE